MADRIAYVAEGKLYLKKTDTADAAQLLESPFVQTMLDRSERTRQRYDWKNQGMAWQLNPAGMMGLGRGAMPNVRQVRVSGLSRGEGDALMYSLETDTVGGLFTYDTAEKHERRIYHRNEFHAQDLARDPATGALALSLRAPDGTAHIGVMDAEGRGLREVTEGDCVDESPAWVVGAQKTLVFQSAGVGRNAAGVRVALGTYAIMKLDLESGEFVTVMEEDEHDLLTPRILPDGSLLFIRRPYELHGPPISVWKVALDVVLWPYRFVVAWVHFFNWFSQVFARKPMITAGGPTKEGPEARYMMLWGKMIDAEKAIRAKKNDARALVPKSWELTRRSASGEERVLATAVLAFDVTEHGRIVYSNGSVVYEMGTDGTSKEVCRGKMIEQVRWV
jgi:hypothetical protein